MIFSGFIFLLPAAGAVGGVLAAAGVPSLLGFGATGIAAGTAAAGMMSASAIASGGGVVAGGVVATMQSIGAAGLTAGMAATAATVGGCAGAAANRFLDDER
ncbi:interferon alpha-inducible protein 27-like protein 2A [Anneissia japonica]|uniref:interferon alpha-inducible protein 27-like protein 2A n=1 Tax=Anneissia japonica TaxID=1529436 RepID=UPI001425A3A3|nr:interferon alpha-inducible protein 27-like protein 2A [Anneissia japonica]